jgi:O-antigen/teichoic acid export membrane protein
MSAETKTTPSLREAAVRSARWVAVEKWGTRITQVVVFSLLARFLVPRDFGLVALATSVVMFMNLFIDQGLSAALVQRERLQEEHCDAAFWTSLGIATLLAGGLVAAAAPLSDLLGNPALTPVVRWLSLSLPLVALESTPGALMERNFQFRSLAIRRLIGVTVGAAVGVACALLGAGVWALVAQTLVASAAGTAVLWRTSTWRPHLRFSPAHARELWSFGMSVLGINLMSYMNQYADRLVLGAIAGPTALGYYYIGLRVMSLAVDSLTAVVATVSLATFSRLQSDLRRLRQAFYTCTRVSAMICIPMFAALAVLAPLVIPLLFGPQWHRSIPVMQILCALGVINSVAYFDRSLLLAVGRERWALGLITGQGLFNVLIAAITAPHGIIAVAIGVTIRQYVLWPVRIWLLRKTINLNVLTYFKQWFTAIGVATPMVLVMAVLLWLFPPASEALQLAVCGGVGVLVLALALKSLAPARAAELMELLPRWPRQLVPKWSRQGVRA